MATDEINREFKTEYQKMCDKAYRCGKAEADLTTSQARVKELEAQVAKYEMGVGLTMEMAARDEHITDLEAKCARYEAALKPMDIDNLNADEIADVNRFRDAMLVKLNTTTQVRCFEGMEDRGGSTWLERQTWINADTDFVKRLEGEVAELRQAKTSDEICGEAVDVANFAMMVFAQAAAALLGGKEERDEKAE